ncbi:hypothetical protein D9615_000822 [Tricholomella constricta]|uniref:Uncharacterized protein n=1 Tax=Tricholomella constricta TaxID=117010 RepID=A0A8H5HRS2_9AGAR|nr:hypothetical protein D9615_000822 [Tricholomella constricta]
MSAPAAATTTAAPPPPPAEPFDDRLTFPPFPQAPPGVTIIPFKDFKERGIQMFATGDNQEEEEERDGLGIPTVELRAKHNTDTCKTETKRKRKKAEQQQARNAGTSTSTGMRKEWWEMWMQNEDLKMTGPYNPHTSSLDRLYEAAADFRKTRTWPPGPTGIAAAWDQFRLFVGLLSNTPVWTRTDKAPQEENENENDSDSGDDEAEAEFEGKENTIVEAQFERGGAAAAAAAAPKKNPARARARPPYALYGVEPIPVGSDEEVKALLNGENARREEQMVEFLNDPELKIKIFLSSYMRKQGLIWSDKNLINIPHLLGFFIRFLLRNRVFPEVDFERAFKRSLNVIEVAQKELILTSKIPKQLSDDLNKAFRACWGQKADGYKPVAPAEAEEEKKVTPEETKDDDANVERDAKRIKLDTDVTEAAPEDDDVKMAVEKFEEELKAANVEVIKVDDNVLLKNAEKLEGIRDNLNPDIDALPTWAADSEGWGNNDDTWGDAENDVVDQWKPVVVDWTPPAPHTLFPWLGPTALPLTHTAGVVECSVRRIKSFTAPPAPGTLPKSPVSAEPEPDAVDVELSRHFAKVVLGPWAGWDAASDDMPHMAVPRILETSRGPINGVVGEDGKVGPVPVQPDSNGEGKEKEDVPERRVRPHDPLNDDITVLVEPAVLPMLSAGLGLGGTWVQIAREEDFGAERKKKKKGKSKKVATRYWYIDELMLILPSFHT